MKAVIALLAVAFLASVNCNEDIECEGPVNVACFVEPCRFAECPSVQGAVCKNYLCRGGCDTRWFVDGKEVTEQCNSSS
ncbi:hypothetical protein BsWGS_08289 [Bradybaena similaris]